MGARCRIDLLYGTIGIEIKRGRPDRRTVLAQLTRYAASPAVTGLVLGAEGKVDLPRTVGGKPLTVLCLNRLWGIAL